MSYPLIAPAGYSFTAFQQGQGSNDFPGTQLDAALANFAANEAAIVSFVSTVIRSDGQLNNGIVTATSLGPSVTLGVGVPTIWATTTAYKAGNTAVTGGKLYYCSVAHTSGVFANDLAAGYWSLMFDYTIPGALGAGVVLAANIATGAVTAAALAANSVTSAAIQSGTVEGILAADGVGGVPIGAVIDFDGLTPPPKWYFPIGQVFSRTTRIENAFLPAALRRGDKRSPAFPAGHGDVDKLLLALFANGVDGVATDLPDRAAHARSDAIAAVERPKG